MRARGGRWLRWGWPTAFAVAALVLFIAYLDQSTRGSFVNSDGASNALQAWDMLHGNLLLHGWSMSDVSFYTTELPQYMLVESIRGLGPDVVHVSAAMTYTLLVLLAGWLAKGRAKGTEGVARALTATGIMLAPQLGKATSTLLLSPDHLGTGVPVLLTWLIIDRGVTWATPDRSGGMASPPRGVWGDGSPQPGGLGDGFPQKKEVGHRGVGPRGRWLVPVSTWMLLAWTAVGDPLAEVIGALPLAAVCGMRAYHVVVMRRESPRACWYELSLAAAAVLSVPAAAVATRLIAADGGWTESAVRNTFAPVGSLLQNTTVTFEGLLELFGADFTGQPMSHQAIFALIHLVGAGLVGWAFWLAVRRLFVAELLVQVLATGIVVNLAAYTFTVQAKNITSTREIVAVLPFGAVLAGRLVADRLLAARLAPAMAVVLVAYAGMLCSDAVQPPVPAPTSDLSVWLAAHDLTQGLAGYWQANSVTLDSSDAVQVRAVAVNDGSLTEDVYWEASKSWYDPVDHDADFVVSVGMPHAWQDQPLVRHMEAVAGRPAKVYYFGPYTIAVWHKNLLARLH